MGLEWRLEMLEMQIFARKSARKRSGYDRGVGRGWCDNRTLGCSQGRRVESCWRVSYFCEVSLQFFLLVLIVS